MIWYSAHPGETRLPTLIFLHGLSSNHLTWEPVAERFHKEGYPTVNVDLRGHGHSDKARRRANYHFPIFANDIEGIIERERIESYVLIGYSYGGNVALDLATRHPHGLKGLVLVSTNHRSPFHYSPVPFVSPVAHFLVNALGWFLVWQSRKKYHYFNPATNPGYWRATFSGYATMPLSVNFWMLSEMFTLDYSHRIGHIKAPSLLIRGGTDPFVSEEEIREMEAKIPTCQALSLGAGHFVAAHHQELVAEHIAAFLKKL